MMMPAIQMDIVRSLPSLFVTPHTSVSQRSVSCVSPACLTRRPALAKAIRCGQGSPSGASPSSPSSSSLRRTCKNCKQQYDPAVNHPTACRYHTAHFGGETKRKFESVHSGGTMDTPGSGKVLQYWHCCGSEDPFDAGCTAAPHCSYDD